MPNTSDIPTPSLIASLRRQPLLVVLRAVEPLALSAALARLVAIGVRHVEIAWSDHRHWPAQCSALIERFPGVWFGAASIVSSQALRAVAESSLSFAVSPVLDPDLLEQAARLGITLVPGVLTPSEVHHARRLGCSMVKLFPASAVGSGYWQRLHAPLGALPFCIAAGGLAADDVDEWLAAGVDAVALGASLVGDQAWSRLEQWLADHHP